MPLKRRQKYESNLWFNRSVSIYVLAGFGLKFFVFVHQKLPPSYNGKKSTPTLILQNCVLFLPLSPSSRSNSPTIKPSSIWNPSCFVNKQGGISQQGWIEPESVNDIVFLLRNHFSYQLRENTAPLFIKATNLEHRANNISPVFIF